MLFRSLDGFDRDWVEAVGRRQAFYTNLPPGTYRFRLQSNEGVGAWTEDTAAWTFTIEPMFYQTYWFYAVVALTLGMAAAGVWRLRSRQFQKALEAAYEAFLPANARLKEVTTAWQMRDGEPNDHTDAAYDATVIATLGEIDVAIGPVCTRLASALDRFGRYGRLLGEALARVRAGDGDWFTRPTVASYHTVWFELHEDLLATLNLDRATETRPGPPAGRRSDDAG